MESRSYPADYPNGEYPPAYVQFLEGGPKYGTGTPVAYDTGDDDGLPSVGYLVRVLPNGDARIAGDEQTAHACQRHLAALPPGASTDEAARMWGGVVTSGRAEWAYVVDAPCPDEITYEILRSGDSREAALGRYYGPRVVQEAGVPDDPNAELTWMNTEEVRRRLQSVVHLLTHAIEDASKAVEGEQGRGHNGGPAWRAWEHALAARGAIRDVAHAVGVEY